MKKPIIYSDGKFMIKKYLSFTLCCLLLVGSNFSLISAQTNIADDASTKIKATVIKRGTGEKKRVTVKMLDGKKLKGYISQSGEDAFTVVDSKTKQSNTVAYRDVAKVENRLSKGDKIALGIVIGVAATAAVVVVSIFSIICRNEGGC
jgi:sRNA-binding regulator protein Hfq